MDEYWNLADLYLLHYLLIFTKGLSNFWPRLYICIVLHERLLFAAFKHFCWRTNETCFESVFAGFPVHRVKASYTLFSSSYGPGEDTSETTTKAEHTSLIVLFVLSSDTPSALSFGPCMFFVIHFFQPCLTANCKEEPIVKCTAQINKINWINATF